jgi:LacI family transcriptional regulator
MGIKKISLKDIATKVGVSTALVSFVLNGKEKEKRVGAEIAKKILQVARDLNYTPNQIAKSLRKGSTMTIGLIVADIANPFFGYLARIIEDEANKSGYTVIFGSSDENNNKSAQLINTLLNRQVDGFIIVPAEGTEGQIQDLLHRNIPVVLVDRFFPALPVSYVALDNYQASRDAVLHLLEKGHKRIGIVAYKFELSHMRDRIAGYVDTMKVKQSNPELLISQIRYDHVREDMENVIHEWVVKDNKVDAMYFATNFLSISGMYCINEHNIKIPDDLAIIGFDGNESFDFFYSPVTYIAQPIDEMGKESVKVLVDLIKGANKTTQIKLKHSLISRKSSG